MLYCNGDCGDDWDGIDGCQRSDADAYGKLKLCDGAAYANLFEVGVSLHQPGFACNGIGENFGNWFGMMDVHFEDDLSSTHGSGSVVYNVNCGK